MHRSFARFALYTPSTPRAVENLRYPTPVETVNLFNRHFTSVYGFSGMFQIHDDDVSRESSRWKYSAAIRDGMPALHSELGKLKAGSRSQNLLVLIKNQKIVTTLNWK